MKKLVLILFAVFFCVTNIFAQVVFEDSVGITRERWRDSMFRIDLNQVSTGILTEYSLFPFDQAKFDGVNNDDDTIFDCTRLFQLHNILLLSKVNGNASLLNTDTLFNRASASGNGGASIPFILLYKQYSRIRSTALSEGLFTFAADSVGLLDVPGRTVSPYNNYNIFALAPFTSSIKQFDPISFSFPTGLWETGGISTVSIDFGDGAGYRSIVAGGSINISYTTEGVKLVKAQINTGSQVLTAQCQITITHPQEYFQPSYSWNIDTLPLYHNDNEYLNGGGGALRALDFELTVNPGAKVTVETSCDNVFDKPIIIVEGFDPDGKLTTTELQRRFSAYGFRDALKSFGYDFVYVEFTKNTTYIENNALVLQAVINKVNQVKTGTNKLSIIGYSMGGLVTRWCLKDMEDKGLAHNVQNYFSYDAPHQGANIPLGLQYLFNYMLQDLPYLKWFSSDVHDLSSAFQSPAARQMLVTYGGSSGSSNLDPLRAAFASRLQAKGYPQLTNNYAIAFGRGNNTVGTKNAGNGSQFTPANPFGPGTKIFDGGVSYVLVNFQSKVYAVPENSTDYIARYRFEGVTFKKIFGIPLFPYITLHVHNVIYSGTYSYDDAPGGNSNTQAQFVANLNPYRGLAGVATDGGHDSHNFVSTVSALDLKNQGFSAGTKWQSNNLYFNVDANIVSPGAVGGNTISSSLSPFKAVITSSSDLSGQPNFDHNDYIEPQNANFISRQLLSTNLSGSCIDYAFCNATPVISGSNFLCSPGAYSASGLPRSGVSITWSSMFGGFSITSGQGTPNITVGLALNTKDTIILTLTNRCGLTRVFKKGIIVGKPASTDIAKGPATSSDVEVTCNPVLGATSYNWLLNGSPMANQHSTECDMFPVKCKQTFLACVSAVNTCGASANYCESFTNTPCLGGFGTFVVSPNPASTTINVTGVPEISSATGVAGKAASVSKVFNEIRLYDQQGKLRKRQVYKNASQASIDVSALPMGVYFIEIINGTDVDKQAVMITK